ncbi:MAG: hypothetical protein MMC33_006960 [Icmadophila ericetorum]|nr:hypothetical protein [Icmadophila ericetorum]
MTESSPTRRSATPSSIPQKRPLGIDDEQHAPAVSSPLNPDFASSRSRRPAAPREQREKKETLKKREAKGVDGIRGATPDSQSRGRSSKLRKPVESDVLSPIKHPTLAPPKLEDFEPPKASTLTPTQTRAGRQYYETSEHVYNRKGYRYIHCIADPAFPLSYYYRQSETEPYGPRLVHEDSASNVLFDDTANSITTEKGFRMARANVCAREGRWYYECKILSGVKPKAEVGGSNSAGDGGHIRLGWARREASLDAPVGFDAYSYGLRDLAGQKVFMSRPKDFMPPGEDFCEGDVIGLEIQLPSTSLHRKVVEGSYNKAVDVSDDVEPHSSTEGPNIVRDRLPIRYKGHLYFEQYEYQATKEMEELMNPSPVIAATSSTATTTIPPNPNHPIPSLRTLPFSSIKVYKNGSFMGTPFTDLLAFLPPASKVSLTLPGARDGLDDGMLGYFPAISVFRGGAADCNFGPDFWLPPPNLHVTRPSNPNKPPAVDDDDVDMIGADGPAATSTTLQATSVESLKRLRPISERYHEQIVEDIVQDIVDEAEIWAKEGGSMDSIVDFRKLSVEGNVPIVAALGIDGNGVIGPGGMPLVGLGTAGVKEIIQEDE